MTAERVPVSWGRAHQSSPAGDPPPGIAGSSEDWTETCEPGRSAGSSGTGQRERQGLPGQDGTATSAGSLARLPLCTLLPSWTGRWGRPCSPPQPCKKLRVQTRGDPAGVRPPLSGHCPARGPGTVVERPPAQGGAGTAHIFAQRAPGRE